jgi:rhodanese-related sulfurtransferase
MLARQLARTVALTAMLAGPAACAHKGAEAPDAPAANLPPRQVQALIQKNRDNPAFAVLDVRTPAEFAAGHLAGAINVDFKAPNFQAQAAKLDRARSYLVYCRTGHRSGLALPILQRLGFTHLLHLEGGISAWQRDGLPVERPPAPAP